MAFAFFQFIKDAILELLFTLFLTVVLYNNNGVSLISE